MATKSVIFRHILVWFIFISYELAYVKSMAGMLPSTLLLYIVFYGLNIGLFYFHAHVILDFAFFKTKRPYLVAITLTGLEIFGYLGLKYALDSILAHWFPTHFKLTFGRQYVLTNVWRCVYFLGFSIAYWSMRYIVWYRDRNHRMETEQLKAIAKNLELENKFISVENAYLQLQISPHLLFNSLNFIYNTVYLQSEKAGKGVMLLSDLMRYSLVAGDEQRTVLLTEELRQIDNLIEISKLRFDNKLFLSLRKKGKLAGIQVIPLILITLVENMMKHANLADPNCLAIVKVEYIDGQLRFETRNKKRASSPYPKGGLGLRNIEKRLKNFYQDRYLLYIDDQDTYFSVTLILYL